MSRKERGSGTARVQVGRDRAIHGGVGLLYTLFVGFPLCLMCMMIGLMLCLTVIGAPAGLAVMALGVKYVTLPNRHFL
jgi:uncharacterized membrane protein YccF (DUF307 family)